MKKFLKSISVIAVIVLLFQQCTKVVDTTGGTSGTSSSSTGNTGNAATPYSGYPNGTLPGDTTKKDSTTTTTNTYDTSKFKITISALKTSACSAGGEVFTLLASVPTMPNNGYFSWIMGDNNFRTQNAGTPITYTYSAAGTYIVKVNLYYNNQIVASKDTTLVAAGTNTGLKPNASFNFNTPDNNYPNRILFANTSSIASASGTITNTYWNLGTPNGDTSMKNSFVFPFPVSVTSANYNVTLKVVSSLGCYDSIVKTVTVPGSSTNVSGCFNYVVTDSCGPGKETFLFTPNISGLPSNVTYYWDFGDGNNSTLAAPSYQYQYSNNYKVTAIVYSSSTQLYTCSRTIKAKGINAFAITNYTNSNIGRAYSFNGSASITNGNIYSYFWTFGDGGVDNILNTSHTYSTPGSYNVTFSAVASSGCVNSITKTITVQ